MSEIAEPLHFQIAKTMEGHLKEALAIYWPEMRIRAGVGEELGRTYYSVQILPYPTTVLGIALIFWPDLLQWNGFWRGGGTIMYTSLNPDGLSDLIFDNLVTPAVPGDNTSRSEATTRHESDLAPKTVRWLLG